MARKQDKIVCTACGKEKVATRDFYSTSSNLYKNIGRLDKCKECISERYNSLLTSYDGKSNESFKHLCLNFDIFYSEEIYLQTMSNDNFLGEYMRLVNSRKEVRDKTSLNNNIATGKIKHITLEDGNVINEQLIVEWGRGRNKEDYMILEKRYIELASRFPSKSPEEQYIIKDICKLELDIEECRRLGKTDKIASLENVKSKKMKDLDIIPSEKKTSMKDEDIRIFGMGMKIYENEKPIPNISDMFKDVDELNSYWERTIVKPMAKMQGLATGEYSLEKGMDEIEFTPEYKQTLSEIQGDDDE